MRVNKLIRWIVLLAALGLLFAPVIFPVCPVEGKPMRCFYTYRAEFIFALLAVIGAITLFFVKAQETRYVLGGALFLVALSIFLLPFSWILGVCAHGDSPCHITALFTKVVSAVLAISSLTAALHKVPTVESDGAEKK